MYSRISDYSGKLDWIAPKNTTPMGRITATRNVNGYVNSGRSGGARSGQLSIKFIF